MSDERPSGLRELLASPLFWGVLVLKLLLGCLVASRLPRELFVPFLNRFVESGFQDPWALAQAAGQGDAFPYPPIMLYLLALPRALASWVLPGAVGSVTALHLLLLRLPLLVCDMAVAGVLVRWFPLRARQVLLYYWCSPVLLYITYWHGQLDLVPTALFLLALSRLREEEPAQAMGLMGLALASKTHLLVALPFLFSYLRRQQGWTRATGHLALAVGTALVASLPYLFRPAFQAMVFGSQEQARVFAFRIPLEGSPLEIFLAPLALTVLWLRFEGYAKKNFDLLLMYLGISFAVFITLAPPRPGYFLWCLPFVVYYLIAKERSRVAGFHLYSLAYLLYFLLGRESDLFDAWRTLFPGAFAGHVGSPLPPHLEPVVGSLLFTVMVATMSELLVQMYQLGVRANVVYRERSRPTMIGLAGDSGAGKDTFAALARDALGEERTLLLAGDDYHRWPRGHENWKVFTHLDVRANDLQLQQEHAFAISEGNSVVKGEYDHETGRFTEEGRVDPRQFVILQGLHSLALDRQRGLCDLRLFLDPQEDLRRYWKVTRDVAERGHEPEKVLESLEARSKDREKFILPQRDQAQLVVRFTAPGFRFEPGGPAPTEVRLELLVENSFPLEHLVHSLRDLPDLEVTYDPFRDTRLQHLELGGEAQVEDLRVVTRAVLPNLEELAPDPQLHADLPGCLQLVFLSCLSEHLRWSGRQEVRG